MDGLDVVGDLVGHLHPGRGSADAQKALLGPVQDLHRDAVPVQTQLHEGALEGGVFGLAAGIVCDIFFSSQTMLFTVLFPVIGFTVGFLVDFFLNRRFFAYAVMAAAALFVSAAAQMFGLLVYKGQNSFALWWTAILQTLWSLPFIFPAYYICKIFPWKAEGPAPSPY